MADRYTSWEHFIVDVVDEANKIENLDNLFDSTSTNLAETIMLIITRVGWRPFLILCGLLLLGPWAFWASLTPFLLNPVGLLLTAIFGIATVGIIKNIYANKELPLAIQKIGKQYKPKYSDIVNTAGGRRDQIDDLLKKAVSDLLHSAKKALSESVRQGIDSYMRRK